MGALRGRGVGEREQRGFIEEREEEWASGEMWMGGGGKKVVGEVEGEEKGRGKGRKKIWGERVVQRERKSET